LEELKSMKLQTAVLQHKFSRLALAVAACAVLTPLTALAAPTGTISFGITPGGGAIGSSTLLDWYLPVGGGFGDFTTGGGSVTYNGGTITFATNTYGQVKDLAILAGTPFNNFLQFYTQVGAVSSHNAGTPGSGTLQTFPTWDLTAFGAPAAVDCATDPGVNTPCSIHVNNTTSGSPVAYVSPIVLTRSSNGGTDVRLDFFLNGRDSSGSAPWTGFATTNDPLHTPGQIAALINSNQSVNVQSWSLAITSVPEPTTLLLGGLGLLGLGLVRRKVRH